MVMVVMIVTDGDGCDDEMLAVCDDDSDRWWCLASPPAPAL